MSGWGPGSKLSPSPHGMAGTEENHGGRELNKRRVKEARLPPDLCPVVEAFSYFFPWCLSELQELLRRGW